MMTLTLRDVKGDLVFESPDWTKWPAPYATRWPNFEPWEFRSRDGASYLLLDVRLLDALQSLRRIVAQPIHINSGFRTPEHNAAIGGAKKSQHVLGRAADIVVSGCSVYRLATLADRVPAFHEGGIIRYPSKGFTHVDVRVDGPYRDVR